MSAKKKKKAPGGKQELFTGMHDSLRPPKCDLPAELAKNSTTHLSLSFPRRSPHTSGVTLSGAGLVTLGESGGESAARGSAWSEKRGRSGSEKKEKTRRLTAASGSSRATLRARTHSSIRAMAPRRCALLSGLGYSVAGLLALRGAPCESPNFNLQHARCPSITAVCIPCCWVLRFIFLSALASPRPLVLCVRCFCARLRVTPLSLVERGVAGVGRTPHVLNHAFGEYRRFWFLSFVPKKTGG